MQQHLGQGDLPTMATGFDPIEIGWKNKNYKIPSDRCFELLAGIENIIQPIQGWPTTISLLAHPEKMHLTKVAAAYHFALVQAGAVVTRDEVYITLSDAVSRGGTEGFAAIKLLSDALITMFFPTWMAKDLGNLEGADAQTADKATTPSAGASSEGSTTSQSVAAG